MTKAITNNPTQSRGGVKADDTAKEAHVRAIYDPETKSAVASTATVDRMGEVIDQSGWDLKNFKNNPVMLWAHDDRIPRIGSIKNIRIDKSLSEPRLMFDPYFNEKTELSKAIKAIYEEEGGTFSVGFMPIEMDGDTYTKQELLEVSAVNVPANPDAMMMAYRSLRKKGFNTKVAEEASGVKRAFMEIFKGPVADELANPDDWEIKTDKMDDVFDIFYAFCDVYFDWETPPSDFTVLLKECVQLLGKVVNGTYSSPAIVQELFDEVVDKQIESDNNVANKVKEQPSAPKVPDQQLRTRQSLVKVIAKASDQILSGTKRGTSQDEQVKMAKIIKRSAEILSKSHKEELNNG